jgi:hypothetical protein
MKSAFRPVAALFALAALLGLILTSCPSNRDGMPGQLASAKQEVESACRSGVLAVGLWRDGRSTEQLASVQLGDARDEVVKAYRGIATLTADDPVDLGRQQFLTASMTTIIVRLNAAIAVVQSLVDEPPGAVHQRLVDAADTLKRDYR